MTIQFVAIRKWNGHLVKKGVVFSCSEIFFNRSNGVLVPRREIIQCEAIDRNLIDRQFKFRKRLLFARHFDFFEKANS